MTLKSKYYALGGVLFVAACGSSAIGLAGIDRFGTAFVNMFAADENAEPVDAQSVPLLVSFTTDPFNP
jgi:hypothetical protein